MKSVMNRSCTQAARSAALAALLCLPALSWGQPPGPPPSPTAAGPPLMAVPSAPHPASSIPDELTDRSFERYVDVKALGDAYLTKNAALMADVGLQLLEGERVLLRSHRGLKSSAVFDAALRVATDQRDLATLDQLGRVAEKIGDKTLGEKVKVSRQLADKPRAVAPPLPAPDENLSANEVIAIQNQFERFERARAVGDVAGLKSLEAELKGRPGTEGSLPAHLAKQVAEVVTSLGDAETSSDEVVAMLGNLSGTSRGVTPLYLERRADWSIPFGAKAYRFDGQGNIAFSDAAFGGINQWYPQLNVTGIKGRFGPALVNLQWTPGNDGKQYFPYDKNPDYVNQATFNKSTNKWDMVWVNSNYAVPLTLTLPNKGSAMVGLNGTSIPVLSLVASGAGNFTWGEIVANGGGNITFNQLVAAPELVAAGAGNIVPPGRYLPSQIDAYCAVYGYTVSNVIKKGGGTITFANLVASGAGNLQVKQPGGYLVASGGGNLTVVERLSGMAAHVIALGDYRLISGAGTDRFVSTNGSTVANVIAIDPLQRSLTSTGPFANAKVYP